jgi:hypothetical protein
VYEWICLKENNDIDVGLGKLAFQKPWLQLCHGLILSRIPFHTHFLQNIKYLSD